MKIASLARLIVRLLPAGNVVTNTAMPLSEKTALLVVKIVDSVVRSFPTIHITISHWPI